MIKLTNIKIVKKRKLLFQIEKLLIDEGINVVVGHNGSGKSLFFKLLIRPSDLSFIKVNGEVDFQFKNISENYQYRYGRIRKKTIKNYKQNWNDFWEHVVYVGQEIKNSRNRYVSEYINDSLDEVKSNKGYNGYKEIIFEKLNINELLEKKLFDLSGGEKQIIELSIAFVRAQWSKYIFLDEPFNHLDVCKIKKINDVILDLKKQTHKPVILIITHCNTITDIDKKFKISNGEIKEINDLSCKLCYHFR